MKKVLLTLAAVAAVGAYASSASAQCSFNTPGKAKGLKLSMVRAFAACPGLTFGATNSTTGTLSTCAKPVPVSPLYKFDSLKGQCSLKTTQKVADPCPVGAVPCTDMQITLKCSGITNLLNVAVDNQSGWALTTVGRPTFNDGLPDANGDMTLFDFPITIPVPATAWKAGKFTLKLGLSQLLQSINQAQLPPCTNIQIVSLGLNDPQGNTFAVMGSATK